MKNVKAILKSLLWRVPIRIALGVGAVYLYSMRKTDSMVLDNASFLFFVGLLLLGLAFWRYKRRDDGIADYAGGRFSTGGLMGLWARTSLSDARASGVFQLDEEQVYLSRQLADVIAGLLFLLPSLLTML